jgi:hypothetical protein
VSGRSFSDVFQDIVRDIHEIVRAEFRLAKAELREEASTAVGSAGTIAAGAVAAVLAMHFLLWAIAFGLALVMPLWAAALVVTAALAISGTVLIVIGRRRMQRVRVTPERTVETLKEHVEWVRQSIK